MAFPVSPVDFTITFSDFLATAVSDGTWADVLQTEKIDRPGQEAPATAIREFSGQLWANFHDNFVEDVWTLNQGLDDHDLDTSGAVTDSVTLATLTVDGDAYSITAEVVAKTATAGEVVIAQVGGLFYRTGGTVLVLNPTHVVNQVGLVGVDADLVINADDVDATVTGIAGKDIAWTVHTTRVKALRAP